MQCWNMEKSGSNENSQPSGLTLSSRGLWGRNSRVGEFIICLCYSYTNSRKGDIYRLLGRGETAAEIGNALEKRTHLDNFGEDIDLGGGTGISRQRCVC